MSLVGVGSVSNSDAVVVDIRTKGAARAAADTRMVASSIGAVSTAAHAGSTALKNFRQNVNLGATASYALKRGTFVAGAGIAGLGALSVKSGIQFNASMEQNVVAFTQFLGSTQAARKELAFLYKTAAVTPFETQNITEAARKMMAFGFSAKSTNTWLTTIGDTISGIGGGPQQIDQLVMALGQIKSKGRLQGDELMQLSELGVVNRQKLAKQLGTTPLALNSGNANIPAAKALQALQAQWAERYGGMAAKQAQTFTGQMSTLHDTVSMTLGKATWPLFTELRAHVLPDLNKAGTEIGRIFDRKDLNFGDKFNMSASVLRKDLRPVTDALEAEIRAAHIPQRVGDEFGRAIPFIASKAGDAAYPAAKAFVNAWLHSGPWGQFLSAAWIAKKTGAFGAAFGALTGKGKGGGAATALLGRGSSPVNPLYVVAVGGGLTPGVPGKKGGKGGRFGKLGSFAGGAAALAAGEAGVLGGAIVGGTQAVVTGKIPGWVPGIGGMNLTDPVIGGKKHTATISAAHNGRPIELTSIVTLEGREIARAVAKQASDARARRGNG
jgi:tape measure domain-containing protein